MKPTKVVKNLPVAKYRAGVIEGVVWSNKSDKGDGMEIEFKTATIRRSWKDNEGTWRDEKINLRKGDIPKAILVLQKLQEEIFLKDVSEGED